MELLLLEGFWIEIYGRIRSETGLWRKALLLEDSARMEFVVWKLALQLNKP